MSSRLCALRWRVRCERGQDVVEYAGVIVLVALLFAALNAVGLPGRVSRVVTCGLQQILDESGGGCTGPGAPGGSGARALAGPGGPRAGTLPAGARPDGALSAGASQGNGAANVAPGTLTAQPCPTAASAGLPSDPSASMSQFLSDPHGVSAGGVQLLAPAPAPAGLQCALLGGGASGRFAAWTASSGLATNARQAYALNLEVVNGALPPMPGNWAQMTPAQRNAFECQASQVFVDFSCGVGLDGQAQLNSSIFAEDTTQTTSSGPSVAGVIGDLAPLATSALQQVCAPECDADPALDAGEVEQDARSLSDLGDEFSGGAEVTTPLAISAADESAAAQDASAAAQEEVPPFARSQYGRMTPAQRAAALERSPTCPYCGEAGSTQADHITSLKQDWSSGGWNDPYEVRTGRANSPENLIGACRSCNASKGAKPIGQGPDEWWPSGWGDEPWPFGGGP